MYRQGISDPISAFDYLIGFDWSSLGYCHRCHKAQRERWEKAKRSVWTAANPRRPPQNLDGPVVPSVLLSCFTIVMDVCNVVFDIVTCSNNV